MVRTGIFAFILASLLVLSGPVHAGTPTFHGQACTKDCSGHKAGYAWAAKKGINDPDLCRGRSKSFVEGCRIRAVEVQALGKKAAAKAR